MAEVSHSKDQFKDFFLQEPCILLLNFLSMDLQMTVHENRGGGKQRTTTCGKDSGTLTMCFHSLHQNSTGVLLNW